MIEVRIQKKNGVIFPAVQTGMTWETQRTGAPGKLCFTAVGGGTFDEGSAVTLLEDRKPVFAGFLFSKEEAENGTVSVTAYDQLRYLKNKDTVVYEKKKAGELTAMLAADFGLQTGVIDDTGWVIPVRTEDNAELFEMIKNALDETEKHTGEHFVLYDDAGKIALRNVKNMQVPLLISDVTASGYRYTSSIDEDSCTKVKLVYEDGKKGARQVFTAEDAGKRAEWGVLQHFDTLKEPLGAQAAAETILRQKCRKALTLSVSGAFGDYRVRAGCALQVSLRLGDRRVNHWMTAERAIHRWDDNGHRMDLTLTGAGFSE